MKRVVLLMILVVVMCALVASGQEACKYCISAPWQQEPYFLPSTAICVEEGGQYAIPDGAQLYRSCTVEYGPMGDYCLTAYPCPFGSGGGSGGGWLRSDEEESTAILVFIRDAGLMAIYDLANFVASTYDFDVATRNAAYRAKFLALTGRALSPHEIPLIASPRRVVRPALRHD
jgi:hypothetical protein